MAAAEKTVEHVGGLPWWEAPIPRRWHRCRAQSRAARGFEVIERCPCGALRYDGYGPWLMRNARRRGLKAAKR